MNMAQAEKKLMKTINFNTNSAKRTVQTLLHKAGITLDGTQPWDIQVNNLRFYHAVLAQGSLGLGESYMLGWWDCDALDVCVTKLFRANLFEQYALSFKTRCDIMLHKLFNFQTKPLAVDVAHLHYDLSNELYRKMLDQTMSYSCGYWKDSATLQQAQYAKLDLLCRKLYLKPGMHLLDIGCGWGGMARYAAKYYGVQVTGVTISQQQFQYAQEYCRDLPVTILLKDYRDIVGKFDRVVSIGMFEHVGYKNYQEYMQIVNRCLTPDGLCALHTIGSRKTRNMGEPWMEKYIFPHGMLPSIKQIGAAIEGLFVMEDWHNFGADYDKTLMAWYQNFQVAWPDLCLHNPKFNDTFRRMWRYYLLTCAGAFRARHMQLWQIILSKTGVEGGYVSVR
ncbi:MAG: cyclopropane fatty acyl phospholipid synthase [Gammaproteobacteria bacterium]